MKSNDVLYIPCIKWKKGEYDAIRELKPITKKLIFPLIEVPEIGYDFEEHKFKKSIDEHLKKLTSRIKDNWGTEYCFVDPKYLDFHSSMITGEHPIEYLFSNFKKEQLNCIPVINLSNDHAIEEIIRKIMHNDNNGVCIRNTLEQLASSNWSDQFASVMDRYKLQAGEIDFIFDLESPNFVPIDGFIKLLIAIINKIPFQHNFRTFAIIGTSFPETMAGIKGTERIERSEWILYKNIIDILKKEGIRIPTFGDYCITHPRPIQLDMRRLKPSAKIQYTIDNGWIIVKGGTTKVKGGFEQYRQLCDQLISTGEFKGEKYSKGDAYIYGCAKKTNKTGNLTTWKFVGTNHHIEKVVEDISNLFEI